MCACSEYRRSAERPRNAKCGAPWAKMAGLLADASFAFCPKGSHMCIWDDQQVYFKHLLDFLHTV